MPISRRAFVQRALSLGSIASQPGRFSMLHAAELREREAPNVLLVLTDEQRTDTLGFLGRTPCRTPALDGLAGGGVSFDRCLTPSPLCLPARTAIFSGRYPHQNNTMGNDDMLESSPALLTTLRERGYEIDYAGKWHLGEGNIGRWVDRWGADTTEGYTQWCRDQGLPDGWAFNDPKLRTHRFPAKSIPATAVSPLKPGQTVEAFVADQALSFFGSRKRDRPFFLICSFYGPHPPFKVPEPYFSMYDPRNIPEPPNFQPCAGEPRSNGASFYRLLWKDHGDTWEKWKKTVAVYWGFVTMVDAQIGRLIEALRKEGILDRTAVVFASDHGEMLGQHGLWQKMHPYEESIRVPLIIRAPWAVRPGLRSQAGASLIDVAPTVLSLCGIESPSRLEGVDLSAALGADYPKRTARLLFSEQRPLGSFHGTTDWRMVTDNRFKYVWHKGDRAEAYDLVSDPYEKVNLIDDPGAQAEVRRLRQALLSWMQRTADPLVTAM